jgi:hypothetical protein
MRVGNPIAFSHVLLISLVTLFLNGMARIYIYKRDHGFISISSTVNMLFISSLVRINVMDSHTNLFLFGSKAWLRFD